MVFKKNLEIKKLNKVIINRLLSKKKGHFLRIYE